MDARFLLSAFHPQQYPPPDKPEIAFAGRSNVGKSSLINALTGEERNIVTPISGTTRDSVHTRYSKFNHDFILVDIEQHGQTPDWLALPDFLAHCHNALTPAGVITFNLVAEQREGF